MAKDNVYIGKNLKHYILHIKHIYYHFKKIIITYNMPQDDVIL